MSVRPAPAVVPAPTPDAETFASCRFRQVAASVELTCNDAAAVAHARATLYAYEQQPDPARPAWSVRIEVVDHLPGTGERFADAESVEIGREEHGQVLRRADEDLWFTPDRPALISIRPGHGVITALCQGPDVALHYTARLVRQAITAQVLDGGAVYGHMAALNHPTAGGIVIGGHRHRGKTTTLVALLRHLGGDFVTNDRILLSDDDGITGVPWPSHMRTGIGTLLAYPDLADLVPAELHHLTANERWSHRDKVSVEPEDFGRLMTDGQVATSTRPALMLWPDIRPNQTVARLERVDPDEARHQLDATAFFMQDPGAGISSHVNHWLIPAPPDPQYRHRVAALVDTFAKTVPCFRLFAGADPAALADAVAELL